MKKVLALLLATIMCASLCACGGGESQSTKVSETVVVDNENYKITITDRSFRKESGNSDKEVPTLAMIIENKTDKDLEFEFKQVSINGFSVDVHHNPENGISSWPVIVNSEKKTKFYLAMITDTITDVSEIKDLEATLVVNQVLEMSQYYNKSSKTSLFEEIDIKAE